MMGVRVSTQITVSGDAASIDLLAVRLLLLTSFHTVVGGALAEVIDVVVSLTSGSVVLDVGLVTDSAAAAEEVASQLAATSTAEMANTWFNGTVSVEGYTQPIVGAVELIILAPSPPASPEVVGTLGAAQTATGIAVGTAVGISGGGIAMAVAICCLLFTCWYCWRRQHGSSKQEGEQVSWQASSATELAPSVCVIAPPVSPDKLKETSKGSLTAVVAEPYDVFISFRFGEAHTEGLALKAALEGAGYSVFLANISPGGNMQDVIGRALLTCRLAVVFASASYGRRTNGLFCTHAEMNFIIGQGKPFYLIRMIPPEDDWEEVSTIMAFPASIMYKLWLPGHPMPADLVACVSERLRALAVVRALTVVPATPSTAMKDLSLEEISDPQCASKNLVIDVPLETQDEMTLEEPSEANALPIAYPVS